MRATGGTFDGPPRLATVGRAHGMDGMGPNSTWPSSQGGEVASSISESSGVTEFRRRAMATSSTIRRCSPTRRQKSRRLNPDEASAAARARVSRLEAALEVLRESDPTDARTVREALNQARCSAQEQPISAQIKDTEEFIARSTNRFQVLAKKRSEEEQLLENATARLARLREFATSRPPPASRPTDLHVQVPRRRQSWPLWKRNEMHERGRQTH